MKSLIIVLIAAVCLVSCDFLKDDEKNGNKGELILVFDECQAANDAVEVCFTKIISDSRCPKNVVCIWEGLAEVEIQATIETDLVATFTLIERAGHPELADTIIGSYQYILNGVSPYPEDPVEIDSIDYTIDITVLKID